MINSRLLHRWASLIFAGILLVGCGGGGGGGGSSTPSSAAPALSVTQALAGQLITISDASIQSDDIVDITFQTETTSTGAALDDTPIVIPVKAIAVADGEVDVAVPVFFDANGLPVTRDVRVEINGVSSATTLHVENPAEPSFATDGGVLAGFLSAAIDNYTNALANLDQIAAQPGQTVDVSAVKTAMQAQLQDLNDQLLELDTYGTYTVVIDGVSSTLTQQQLEQVDRQLLMAMVSYDVSADAASGSLAAIAAQRTDLFQYLKDAWEEGLARIEQAQANSTDPDSYNVTKNFVANGVPDVLKKGLDAAKKYVTYVGGYLSLTTAGAGTFGDEALGDAAAAHNIRYSRLSALMSTLTSYLSKENTDAFLGDVRDGFNSGQELLSQGLRVGTAYLGALPGKLGKITGMINTGLSVKDMLTEAKVNLCDAVNTVANLCSDGSTSPSSRFKLIYYQNFDGTQQTAGSGNPQLDWQEADIQLSGSQTFPTFSWPGNGIAITVVDALNPGNGLLYGINSVTEPDSTQLIPFHPPVRYGNYRITNTEILGGALSSSPALQTNGYYTVTVQRSDFKSAFIGFQLQ